MMTISLTTIIAGAVVVLLAILGSLINPFLRSLQFPEIDAVISEDEDVIESLNDDLSFFQAASELCVPAEILDFKFRTMKWKGSKIREAPLLSPGNWLKGTADDGRTDDFYGA